LALRSDALAALEKPPPRNPQRSGGGRLAREVSAVLKRHPKADPELVRLTLIALQSSLLES